MEKQFFCKHKKQQSSDIKKLKLGSSIKEIGRGYKYLSEYGRVLHLFTTIG
jgi:hypothetical protein